MQPSGYFSKTLLYVRGFVYLAAIPKNWSMYFFAFVFVSGYAPSAEISPGRLRCATSFRAVEDLGCDHLERDKPMNPSGERKGNASLVHITSAREIGAATTRLSAPASGFAAQEHVAKPAVTSGNKIVPLLCATTTT